MDTVFTIGHSTHTLERLVVLLRQHGITAVCDVRSRPYSRMNPQFNRETLSEHLRESDIQYVFLGKELGARSEDPQCYEEGTVQYDRLAKTELFRMGIERVRNGMRDFRLVIMCAEKEPLDCHRTILVARHLVLLGLDVQHIREDGTLESQAAALDRLRVLLKLPEEDMFRSREDVQEDAYRLQSERIAYRQNAASGANEHVLRP